ncbi:HCP-like protein [Gigaspora margarita]|uniref:HCP-like protein n=1 Tax=Gigaspora margarita TaxID=4874 RepID=A0A8H4B0B4_GIGMA|nr:HCP-like protein [Gigaspora margarita]
MGHAIGTYYVGCCYRDGIGVEKDECKAFVYYQKSAEMGAANGHGFGVEKDEHKAFEHYLKAANMDLVVGMTQVARCFRNGVGVERDLQKSNYWYQRAKSAIIDNVSERIEDEEEWWNNKNLNNSNENEIKNEFIEADKIAKKLPIIAQQHPDHIYTSKLINTREITKRLSKLIASKPIEEIEIPDNL